MKYFRTFFDDLGTFLFYMLPAAPAVIALLLIQSCNVVDTQAGDAGGVYVSGGVNLGELAVNYSTDWDDVVETPIYIPPGSDELFARFRWATDSTDTPADLQYVVGGLSSVLTSTTSDIPVLTESIRMPQPPEGWQVLRVRTRGKSTVFSFVVVAR